MYIIGFELIKGIKVSIEITNTGNKKPQASRIHAIRRAKDRYDLDLTIDDIERIELRIRQPYEAFFLDRQSKTRSTWLIRVEGLITVVIYNSKQKCLSTFLPVWYAKRYFNCELNNF